MLLQLPWLWGNFVVWGGGITLYCVGTSLHQVVGLIRFIASPFSLAYPVREVNHIATGVLAVSVLQPLLIILLVEPRFLFKFGHVPLSIFKPFHPIANDVKTICLSQVLPTIFSSEGSAQSRGLFLSWPRKLASLLLGAVLSLWLERKRSQGGTTQSCQESLPWFPCIEV
jgi:hypothetical protein